MQNILLLNVLYAKNVKKDCIGNAAYVWTIVFATIVTRKKNIRNTEITKATAS